MNRHARIGTGTVALLVVLGAVIAAPAAEAFPYCNNGGVGIANYSVYWGYSYGGYGAGSCVPHVDCERGDIPCIP